MERHLYFLSVREHIGGEELAAEMAKAAQRQGRRVVVHPRARAEDLNDAPQAAAAIVLFTYADFDLAAASKLLKSLPKNECGLIPVAALTPARAPFLQALRERARDILAPGNPADFIEIANTVVSCDNKQLAPALKQLSEIIFAQEFAEEKESHRKKEEEEAKAKAEAGAKAEADAKTEAEAEKQAAEAEAEAERDASSPSLLSLAAHLGFPLDKLWRDASKKTPDCGLSDPFTTPPPQLRREITALLRKDFEQHKNNTKVHITSIRHPRNARYDIVVFAFAILCHRMHEDESSGEHVMYDEMHLFDHGGESPLFPLFALCWIFAAEDMIAQGKSGEAKTRLESIVRSFRKQNKAEAEGKGKAGAKGSAKGKKNKTTPAPPILQVMALRAMFYVARDDEARKKVADDLNHATQLLSEGDRQIINARARFFAAVNKAREEIKDLL